MSEASQSSRRDDYLNGGEAGGARDAVAVKFWLFVAWLEEKTNGLVSRQVPR